MSFWRVLAIWLLAQPLLAFGWWLGRRAEREGEKARRRAVGRRLAEAARFLPVYARPPAGPAADALRAAQLRMMLDRTEPTA